MEEQVKTENVVVEVKEKKKISKKVLAWGAGALALGIGVVVLLTRGNKDGDTGSGPVTVDYEPVSNDSEVGE